jgi:membrane protease YdiL (CAAX protease family)
MTSPTEPRTPEPYHAPLRVAAAAWIAAGGVLTMYVFQLGLGEPLGGLNAAAAGYIAVIALVVALGRIRGFSLGVDAAPARFFVAAAMIGVAAWYVDLRIVERLAPPSEGSSLEHVVTSSALGASLIALAILPAIAEELVFRGVLARSLAPHGAVLAVVASAIAFSLYHIDRSQMVGTFPLGLALGVLAVRSGSVVPGMITHLLNNAIVLVLAHSDVPGLDTLLTRHGDAALVGASMLVLGGVMLATVKIGGVA